MRKITKNPEYSKMVMVMVLILALAVGAAYVYIHTPDIESTQVAHTQSQS